MGVSRRSVQRARVVVDARIDELTALVSARKLSLGAAEKFASLPENEALYTTRADKEHFARCGASSVRHLLKTLDNRRLAQLGHAAVGQLNIFPPLTPNEQERAYAAIEVLFRDHPIEKEAAKFQSRQNHDMAIIAAHAAKVNEMLRILPGLSHEHANILGLVWYVAYEKVKAKLGSELYGPNANHPILIASKKREKLVELEDAAFWRLD